MDPYGSLVKAAESLRYSRGSRRKYVGEYGSSWKLPRNMCALKLQLIEAMEGSTSTESGNFRVFPWKRLLSSMEVNLLTPISMEISMEANLLPPTTSFHGSTFASMGVSGSFDGSRSKISRM